MNQTNIEGGCQSRRKVAPHDSKSDLPLGYLSNITTLSMIMSLSEVIIAPVVTLITNCQELKILFTRFYSEKDLSE